MSDRKLRPRVRSFEVAEHAGVSQSTVSRALANSSSITEATRARVIKSAEALGYMVDTRAAQLRQGRTGMLAVVVICRAGEAASDINPFYFSLLGSVCAAASGQGYQTLVSFQATSDQLFGKYEESGQADGVIVIGTAANHQAWDYFRALSHEQRAAVFWGSPFDELEWVRSDNFEGGLTATNHLIDAGYRQIAHLGAVDSTQRQFRERYEGYCAAMEAAGLSPRLQQVDSEEDRETQGRNAVASLIDSGEAFDALFVACDSIALGAMDELRMRGITVPDECALVGFDGIRAGIHTSPPLTSIEPDFEVAGAMLVAAVLGQSDGQAAGMADGHIAERRVPVRLLERGSVRRAK